MGFASLSLVIAISTHNSVKSRLTVLFIYFSVIVNDIDHLLYNYRSLMRILWRNVSSNPKTDLGAQVFNPGIWETEAVDL